MKALIKKAAFSLGLFVASGSYAYSQSLTERLLSPVRVRTTNQNAQFYISVAEYRSQSSSCAVTSNYNKSSTLVALHGLAHTAATWKPFAEAVFAADEAPQGPQQTATPQLLGQHICRVIAFDMPGRGPLAQAGPDSENFPSGFVPAAGSLPVSLDSNPAYFGRIRLTDYVSIAIQVLESLKTTGTITSNVTVIGHSLGALVWELAEEELRTQNRSLKNYGVAKAIFLASSIPSPLPWAFANVNTQIMLNPFMGSTPELGVFYGLPDMLFPTFFMSDRALFSSTLTYLMTGQGFPQGLQAASPTVADIRQNAYNAIEPLFAAYQLLRGGLQEGDGTITEAPTVRRGVFSSFLETALVAFSEDPFVQQSEMESLASHLVNASTASASSVVAAAEGYTASRVTYSPLRQLNLGAAGLTATASGTPGATGVIIPSLKVGASLTTITGPLAVHDFYLTEPALLVKLLKK